MIAHYRKTTVVNDRIEALGKPGEDQTTKQARWRLVVAILREYGIDDLLSLSHNGRIFAWFGNANNVPAGARTNAIEVAARIVGVAARYAAPDRFGLRELREGEASLTEEDLN